MCHFAACLVIRSCVAHAPNVVALKPFYYVSGSCRLTWFCWEALLLQFLGPGTLKTKAQAHSWCLGGEKGGIRTSHEVSGLTLHEASTVGWADFFTAQRSQKCKGNSCQTLGLR